MILSDLDILDRLESGDLDISPIEDLDMQLQPASVDLRLGEEFLEFQRTNIPYIHPDSEADAEGYVEETVVPNGEDFILHPGDFVLGTTRERVDIPDDLVAHVEGRSSLGRLAIVVHASLPYDEKVFLWTPEGGLGFYEIGEIVEQERVARAVSFDPQTMAVSTHRVTDHITNPTKQIYRVSLESGRTVRVTRDHNLFTLDAHGGVTRVASEDAEGTLVMIPENLPGSPTERRVLGEPVTGDETTALASDGGGSAAGRIQLPTDTESVPTTAETGVDGRSSSVAPGDVPLTTEFGVIAGAYLGAGTTDNGDVHVGPADPALLDRVAAWFREAGADVERVAPGADDSYVVVQAPVWAHRLRALDAGTDETGTLSIPDEVWDWPETALRGLLEGLTAAGVPTEPDHTASLSGPRPGPVSNSRDASARPAGPVARVSYLLDRVQQSRSAGDPPGLETCEGPAEGTQDNLKTEPEPDSASRFLPVPQALLGRNRQEAGLTVETVAEKSGIDESAVIALEDGNQSTVSHARLQRLRDCYAEAGASTGRLTQLLEGDVRFEQVTSVTATDRVEPTYDLEVQPGGQAIENFLGGSGGVFLSNTAGLCDPGYRGQITLELSNLGTAPVALSPGMRVSQLTFTELSSPADRPYGVDRGSKYQNQDGPQASRIGADPEFDDSTGDSPPAEDSSNGSGGNGSADDPGNGDGDMGADLG